MKISSFLTFLALAACSVSSCRGSKASLHEDVLKDVNRTLVRERFNFFEDFGKFCRSYEKGMPKFHCFFSNGSVMQKATLEERILHIKPFLSKITSG